MHIKDSRYVILMDVQSHEYRPPTENIDRLLERLHNPNYEPCEVRPVVTEYGFVAISILPVANTAGRVATVRTIEFTDPRRADASISAMYLRHDFASEKTAPDVSQKTCLIADLDNPEGKDLNRYQVLDAQRIATVLNVVTYAGQITDPLHPPVSGSLDPATLPDKRMDLLLQQRVRFTAAVMSAVFAARKD